MLRIVLVHPLPMPETQKMEEKREILAIRLDLHVGLATTSPRASVAGTEAADETWTKIEIQHPT